MTRMALCPRERGRGPIISHEMTDQGPSGTECRWSRAARLVWSGFTHCTPTDILLSIFHHVHPPVGFQESTLHLPHTRVPSSREVMFVAENTLPYICRHPCDVAISP